MTLDPTLMSLLACPSDDHAPLREETHGGVETLVCSFCATRFPVLDGIPVLLLDDAVPGPHGVGVAAETPPPAVPDTEVVAAAPVDDEVATVAAPPVSQPAEPVAPERPLTVDAFAGRVPFDSRLSPKHALPDTAEEVPSEAAPAADEQADPDVEVEPDLEPVVYGESDAEPDVPTVAPTAQAAPTPNRPVTPPPGARSRTSALRDRVQQRLAELEATRGPRGKRRGGTGT